MSIADRKNKTKEVEQQPIQEKKPVQQDSKTELTLDELEFLIRLIGDSNFKGNNLMFMYDLVKKLQNKYVNLKGGQ